MLQSAMKQKDQPNQRSEDSLIGRWISQGRRAWPTRCIWCQNKRTCSASPFMDDVLEIVLMGFTLRRNRLHHRQRPSAGWPNLLVACFTSQLVRVVGGVSMACPACSFRFNQSHYSHCAQKRAACWLHARYPAHHIVLAPCRPLQLSHLLSLPIAPTNTDPKLCAQKQPCLTPRFINAVVPSSTLLISFPSSLAVSVENDG